MNRYIPFGYKIEKGAAAIHEIEAAAVRTAFEMYLGGASYLKIAKYMETGGISYHSGSVKWNKNMVKRILENERYTGIGDYPQIIDTADYEKISGAKPQKYIYKKPTDNTITIPAETKTEFYIYEPSLEITRLSNEIKRELNQPQADKEKITTLILQCASAKYAELKQPPPRG
jgi:hypothetical protein